MKGKALHKDAMHFHLEQIHVALSALVEQGFTAQSNQAAAAAVAKGGGDVAADADAAAALPDQLTQFSTAFYVRLARAKIGGQDAHAVDASAHVSQDRLWSEIMDNLGKDVAVRSKIDLAIIPATSASSVGASTEIDTVVFTCCSTTIPRRQFYELDVPEF